MLTWDNYDAVIPTLIEQYYNDYGNIGGVYRKIYVFHIAISEILSTFSKDQEHDLFLRIYEYESAQSERTPSPEFNTKADEILKILISNRLFSYKRRTKFDAMKHFLISLLDYKKLHDSRDDRKLLGYNLYHPSHFAKRKLNLYPLSRNRLRSWHGHYNEVMPILSKAGIIERSNFGYWARKGNGICYYYKINIEEFINSKSKMG